jgi:hypothetical protein
MTAATVAATAVEAATAAHCATVEAATDRYVRRTATETADRAASAVPVTAPAVTGAKTTSAPAGASVEAAVEPRACADEKAAGEIARTVVTVRRAGVGVIPVVTVSAGGGRTNISRANAYTHGNALCASVGRKSQGRSKNRKNH